MLKNFVGAFWFLLVLVGFFCGEKNKVGRLGVFKCSILVLCNYYPKYSFFPFFHWSCRSSLWWTAL